MKSIPYFFCALVTTALLLSGCSDNKKDTPVTVLNVTLNRTTLELTVGQANS